MVQLSFVSLLAMTQGQINPCLKQLEKLCYSNGISIFPFLNDQPYWYDNLPQSYTYLGFYAEFTKSFNLTFLLIFLPILLALIPHCLIKSEKFNEKYYTLKQLRAKMVY